MKVAPIKTRIFLENENLFQFIIQHLPHVKDKSIIVVTSKIAALSEGRTLPTSDAKTKRAAILKESQWAKRTKYVWLTIKDGMFMAAAGIDESNSNGKLILLPIDSFKSARDLRKKLLIHYRIKRLGVAITDSRTAPLRAGITGVCLGYAGFRGTRDYRGQPDIFGRKFHMSQTNIADSIAAAAVLVMGEGKEQQPLALISELSIAFCDRVSQKELLIPIRDDMYKPLFKGI
jgi:dihydrofolate synthase / folylpolyglutamate synthase